jgi:hypothetical protein
MQEEQIRETSNVFRRSLRGAILADPMGSAHGVTPRQETVNIVMYTQLPSQGKSN